MPYPPSPINKKGKISLTADWTMFFISTYFDDRKAISTASRNELSDAKTVRTIKKIKKYGFFVINANGGEKNPILIAVVNPKIKENKPTSEKVELIRTSLSFVVGKNLIIPVVNPSNASEESKLTTAISEVAIPI